MEPDLDELEKPQCPEDADVVVKWREIDGKEHRVYQVLTEAARLKFFVNWGPADSPQWQGNLFVVPIRLANGRANPLAYISLWAFGLKAYTDDGAPWLPPKEGSDKR